MGFGGGERLFAGAAGKLAAEQGKANKAMLDYQAQVENDNAMKVAAIIREAGRKQQGATTVAYAGAGVKVGEGAAETDRAIAQSVEQDAFQALLDGGRRASGLRVEGVGALAQGKAAQAAGYANAATTLMSGSYAALRSNGWRTKGPGFQWPADAGPG